MAIGTVLCALLINQVSAVCELTNEYIMEPSKSHDAAIMQPYDSLYPPLMEFTGLLQVAPGVTVPEQIKLVSIPVPSVKPVYVAKIVPKPKKITPKKRSKSRNPVLDAEDTNSTVMAFASSSPRGLAKLLVPKPSKKQKSGTLFVKSEGNEITQCLSKNKKLWNAMKLVKAKFGTLVIESGYRSPAYNAALRKKGIGAAKHSFHMKCMAIDFYVKNVKMKTLWKYVIQLQNKGLIGGVGYYPGWVHMDNGPTRSW